MYHKGMFFKNRAALALYEEQQEEREAAEAAAAEPEGSAQPQLAQLASCLRSKGAQVSLSPQGVEAVFPDEDVFDTSEKLRLFFGRNRRGSDRRPFLDVRREERGWVVCIHQELLNALPAELLAKIIETL
jgi:hypothetical protein